MGKRNKIFEYEFDQLIEWLDAVLVDQIEYSEEDTTAALVLMSYNEVDFERANKLCVKFFNHDSVVVKKMVLQSVGNIARVYEKLVDQDLFESIIKIYNVKKNPLCGDARQALADIKIFLKIPITPQFDRKWEKDQKPFENMRLEWGEDGATLVEIE